MGKLKDELKKIYKEEGSRDKAIKKAQSWFQRGKKPKDGGVAATNTPFKPGMIYVFRYEDPIYADTLPWWDQNPVVLALDQSTDKSKNDVGINLNLLPSEVRIELLDLVYTKMYSSIEAQKKKGVNRQILTQFTYKGAIKYLEKFGYEMAIRQYSPKLKTDQKVVAFSKWPYMAICNLLDETTENGNIKLKDADLKKIFDDYVKSKKNPRKEFLLEKIKRMVLGEEKKPAKKRGKK